MVQTREKLVLLPQIFLDASTYVRFTNGRYAIPGASSPTSLVTPAIVIDAVCDSFSIALTNKYVHHNACAITLPIGCSGQGHCASPGPTRHDCSNNQCLAKAPACSAFTGCTLPETRAY